MVGLSRRDVGLRPLLWAGVLLLGGCGGSGPRLEVLHFWAMGAEAEVVTQLIPEF